ncbi:hypothetical protein [Abyssalbus ytuae]|uniref:Uncharacterized protein n=1 Tax=Abyssalbus ytuae TaxID=2926907 RepID=A0A9E7CYG3_9FLAO|nr:hypothetical protein [Abyssalbus ytuae]UOB16615.1 hypothetical protein MQE35_12820 [Abyssalbus ytuae]
MKQRRTNICRRLTDRRKKAFIGYVISFFLITSPFLFYLYRVAPSDSKEWQLGFLIIKSGGFANVQFFLHALFTKLILCTITTVWFFTCQSWWKYAILVPITMFLFQLTGVLNYKIQYIDEYDFWYSLPVVIPIVASIIIVSGKISKYTTALDLKDEIEKELSQMIKN